MGKQSQLDKAVASLEQEIKVLQVAVEKLKAEKQKPARTRTPKLVTSQVG
jgi:uncharacterized small protein (DUF1192 family)